MIDSNELRQRITDRVEAELRPKTFTPFPVPVLPTDLPLVQHAGYDYTCTGCGTHVPDGLWIHETTDEDMVVGLRMVRGADGPTVHQCGRGA